MRARSLLILILLPVLIAPIGSTRLHGAQDPVAAESPDAPPRDIGLEARTGQRLVQLDVTVRGPRDKIAKLSREDFELIIAGEVQREFTVDDLCVLEPEEQTAPPEDEAAPPSAVEPSLTRLPSTFILYFDQHHLTQAGRQNALDTARQILPRIVVGANRAMIVSAGKELVNFTKLTSDLDALLEALDRVEHDRDQVDTFPYQEDSRVAQVVRVFDDGDIERAKQMARGFQQQERWRTDKALRLFSTVVARLSEVDPPKSILYFADTMRRHAGAHYLSFFGRSSFDQPDAMTGAMQLSAFNAVAPFDRVLEEAGAHGVRVYSIQAEGMTAPSTVIGSPGTPGGGNPLRNTNRTRIREAQDSLASLALESGGQHFLNGVSGTKIAERIRQDIECVYLFSFDPRGLPRDEPLAVRVRPGPKGVEARARGQIVIMSEERRDTSRLLSAFASPDLFDSDLDLAAVVVPTGYVDGEFHALVQLQVPAYPLERSVWDLGASLVSRGRVRDEPSRRVEVGSGQPIVFESLARFRPGPFEVVGVAHETRSDDLLAGRLEGEWPDPDQAVATIGKFAVLQPARGVFLRGDEIRHEGALATGDGGRVRTELPAAVVGLVCRGRTRRRPVRVERRLVGAAPVDFPSLELDFGEERCVQLRDRIEGGTMTAGSFTYEVSVRDESNEDTELARSDLRFFAVEPEAGGPALSALETP